MNLDAGTGRPNGAAAPPRRAILVADPGNGLRWLGWSRGWSNEAAAASAVDSLETLSVSRQITDVAGFLCADAETWIVSRGGLMPETDQGNRYWREALQLGRADLERIRANPFRLMPHGPPPSPEPSDGVELPAIAPPKPATADMDTARIRELRTRPWGRASWNIETLLAAALDVEHTLVTGTAVSLAALELLILLLPPSLRPAFTFHTYALAEPRRPLPRLVFTQFEDDWLFPETAAFGHRLPATELRISKRARTTASELLGLLDTPDRLAEAHATYESLDSHVALDSLNLLREVETILSLARMLAVREHGHAGAGIRVLEQEIARIGPTDWLGPESARPEQVRIDVLCGLLLDAFAPRAVGSAIVDTIQSGHESAAPLIVMRRFLRRHPIGTPEAERFGLAFGRLPEAAWPDGTDAAAELRALIAQIAPEPETPSELPEDWDETIPPAAVEALADPVEENPQTLPDAEEPAPAGEAEVGAETDPAEVSPETEVLRTLVAGLAREAAGKSERAKSERSSEASTHPAPPYHLAAKEPGRETTSPADARPERPTYETIRDRLRETALLNETSPADRSAGLLGRFFEQVEIEEKPAVQSVQEKLAEPAARVESDIDPAAPVESIEDPAAPVESVSDPAAPVESIEDPAAPIESAIDPAALVESVSDPVAPVESAARPAARVESAINPEHARFIRPGVRSETLPPSADGPPPPVPKDALPEPAAAPGDPPVIVGPLLVPEEEVTRTPIRLPKRALAMAATLAGLLAIGFAARTYIVGSAATEGSGQVSDGSEVTAAPSEGPDQFFVFNDQMAAARDRAAGRDWAGVREAVGVAFAGLTAAESFVRDSLLANASLELARMASQGAAQRTTFFVNVFEHTSRALAAVPPFAPGTDAMRLMQAEACLEGSLDCDSGGVVENLVLAGRSSSARIRGRATDLLARTSPVSHDAAVLVSNDGGPGRL